jgi:hypothetical protein
MFVIICLYVKYTTTVLDVGNFTGDYSNKMAVILSLSAGKFIDISIVAATVT